MIKKIVPAIVVIAFLPAAVFALPLTDCNDTVALWHMDSVSGGYVLDDDSNHPGRDHDLELGYAGFGTPVLTTANGGLDGEALVFDGASMAWAASAWSVVNDSVKVEFWMYIENLPEMAYPESGANYLFYTPGCWEFVIQAGNRLYFKVFKEDGSNGGYLYTTVEEDRWYHVTAEYRNDWVMSLQVDDWSGAILSPAPMGQHDSHIYVGGRIDKPVERCFDGKLEEVKISWATSIETEELVLVDGGSIVTLLNSEVILTIDKDEAKVISLKKSVRELLGASNCKGYFQRNADSTYTTPANCQYEVIQNTDDIIEVSFTEDDRSRYPFLFETHFVLKKNESGFYNFTILEYDPALTATANLEQLNLTFRLDPSIFTIAQVADDRWEVMPTIADMQVPPAVEVMDASYLLPETSAYYQNYDPVYTKYNMSAMFDEKLRIYGTCGDGVGVWEVLASNEYMNGVPTSQELTVHQTDTTAVLIRTMCGAHYGSGTSDFDSSDGVWRKLYGPWFIYLNEGADRQAMWTDAKVKAAEHVEQWPYEWMVNADYQIVRGSAAGNLYITDGSNPEGALVILAQPEGGNIPNWQRQGKDYIFWGRADGNGDFTVENVRDGTYTLYALVGGVMDEYRLDNVTVSGGQVTDLGQLNWTPLKYGRKTWQVGSADRDSTEFFRGDDFRHWGMWYYYPDDFPEHVNFTIGESNESVDWNYLQPCVETAENVYELSPWRINFPLARVPQGTGYIRVAVAGAREASLKIFLNDEVTALADFVSLLSDSANPRSGSRGYYRELVAPFDCSLLNEGNNTIILLQYRAGRYNSILYDAVRLELPYFSDMNGDKEVDMPDLLLFASEWLSSGESQADFNVDGIVNLEDLAIFSEEYHQ